VRHTVTNTPSVVGACRLLVLRWSRGLVPVSLALGLPTQDGVVWGAWACSEEAQRRCNSHVATQARGCSRTLLLAGQPSIERRVRRTHRGNLLAHVGAQVRPPLGNERATKKARAAAPRDARHKNGLTSATTWWQHSRHTTTGMHPHLVRCRFLCRVEPSAKTGAVTCASQGRSKREMKV